MNLFKFLLRESKPIVFFAVIAGLISGASSAGIVAWINTALDKVQSPTAALIWGFVGLCLVRITSEIISEFLLIYLAQRSVFDLRMRLSRQILATPLRQLETIGPARLLAALTSDILDIANAITFSPLICVYLAVMIGCLVYLGWLSWILLLVMLAFFAVGMLTYQFPQMSAGRSLRLARQDADSLYGHLRALTEGTKELKLHHNRRKIFLSDFLQSASKSLMRHRIMGMGIFRIAGAWGDLLFVILIAAIILVSPLIPGVDERTLRGFVFAILYMTTPLATILNVAPTLSTANVALRQIDSLGLSLAENVAQDSATPLLPAPSWKRLELRGVTHTYHREQENDSFTLGPIDLAFETGQVVFMGGGNGSGKTTFAKILTGLYTPEAGEIHFDGQLITDENREGYRQNFSAVFSDFYLFESFLGLETPDLDAKARDYLTQFQLNHKVKVEQGTLSTTDLSQGQRKRLALLTTYLEDRPFYVFDEWAADQDPLFREIFYTRILSDLKKRGKTVLVITHDDRYYHLATRFIKLDYGKVSYDGAPLQ